MCEAPASARSGDQAGPAPCTASIRFRYNQVTPLGIHTPEGKNPPGIKKQQSSARRDENHRSHHESRRQLYRDRDATMNFLTELL